MSPMTKLDGREASILAFIARFPSSSEAARLARTLNGPAKKIADSLLYGSLTPGKGEQAAAEISQKWAAAS